MKTTPTPIEGRWREGYALDFHTLSSERTGIDEYGNPVFDTQRSELGELLYRLKYRDDPSVIGDIVSTASMFLRCWNPPVTCIVPVPPSRGWIKVQPVREIADRLGMAMAVPVLPAVTRTKETTGVKFVDDPEERARLLQDAFDLVLETVAGQTVLLLDDLCRSGATMSAVANLLYAAGVPDIYALAVTRTRSRR